MQVMQRGQRPWSRSSRGTGRPRGRGTLLAGPWPPDSEVKLGRLEVDPAVEPTEYGRPRGDAGAYPGGDFLTLWPAGLGRAVLVRLRGHALRRLGAETARAREL